MPSALFLKCPLCSWSLSSVSVVTDPAFADVRRQVTEHLQVRHELDESDAALTARSLTWKAPPRDPSRQAG